MLSRIKNWLKTSEHPLAKALFPKLKALRSFGIPAPKFIFKPLFIVHSFLSGIFQGALRIFYWTPLFKSQLASCGDRLYIYGGMPRIQGNLHVEFGSNVRISGATSFSGRSEGNPQLIVGNNIDIGWLTGITVGTKVIIEDDVRISGRSTISGYPGHPMNPEDRALGLPEVSSQIGDIVLEKGVWLGNAVIVTSNVRIGHGTVVAAGSIVTHDLPPNVLAGGMPARVIKPLPGHEAEFESTKS